MIMIMIISMIIYVNTEVLTTRIVISSGRKPLPAVTSTHVVVSKLILDQDYFNVYIKDHTKENYTDNCQIELKFKRSHCINYNCKHVELTQQI